MEISLSIPRLSSVREGLTPLERELLGFVYDHWKENGDWPERNIVLDKFEDPVKIAEAVEALGEAFIRAKDQFLLTAAGLGLVERANDDVKLLLRIISEFVTRFENAQTTVVISDEELVDVYDFHDEVRVGRYTSFIINNYLCVPDSPNAGIKIEADILRFRNVRTIDDFYQQMYANPYCQGIYVYNSRVKRHFSIPFAPDKPQEFQHLIITGMNGSGKSSILEAIDRELKSLQSTFFKKIRWRSEGSPDLDYQRMMERTENAFFIQTGLDSNNSNRKTTIELEDFEHFTTQHIPQKEPRAHCVFMNPLERAAERLEKNEMIYLYLRAHREGMIKDVDGPKKLDKPEVLLQTERVSEHFQQYLVNRRTDQAFAREEGEDQKADEIQNWFEELVEIFQTLFENEKLQFIFDNRDYSFEFRTPGDIRFGFNELADGHEQIITIIAEIFIRIDAYQELQKTKQPPPGIVVIDEIETHLHLELQERVLPFLTTLFPTIQFIVATHSPAVIASIENATVYDLSADRRVTEPLIGLPYNVLMKRHFGLESEYSIKAQTLIRQAVELLQKTDRTPTEEQELGRLTDKLETLSPDLALTLQMERERIERREWRRNQEQLTGEQAEDHEVQGEQGG